MGRYEVFYCHDATCLGAEGFEILLHDDTETEPGWVFDDDTCPHCGHFIYEFQLDKEAFIDGINVGFSLGKEIKDISDEDFEDLKNIILKELKERGVEHRE